PMHLVMLSLHSSPVHGYSFINTHAHIHMHKWKCTFNYTYNTHVCICTFIYMYACMYVWPCLRWQNCPVHPAWLATLIPMP
uniref:Uncharacterized protein n=1 Tax=Apteryx owenii TaxID=8824 RepID=A0A8B9PFA6_APTOW